MSRRTSELLGSDARFIKTVQTYHHPRAFLLLLSLVALTSAAYCQLDDLAPIQPARHVGSAWQTSISLPWGVGPEDVFSADGIVIVGSGNEIAALNAKSGREMWRAKADWIVAPPNVRPLPWYRPMGACFTRSRAFVEFGSVKGGGLLVLDLKSGERIAQLILQWRSSPRVIGDKVLIQTYAGVDIFSEGGKLLDSLSAKEPGFRNRLLARVPAMRGRLVHLGTGLWADGRPAVLPEENDITDVVTGFSVHGSRVFTTYMSVEDTLRPIEGLEYNPVPGGQVGIVDYRIKLGIEPKIEGDAWKGMLCRHYNFNEYGASCFGPVCALEGQNCFAYFLKGDGQGNGTLYLAEFPLNNPTMRPKLVTELNRRLPAWHIYSFLPVGSGPLLGRRFLFQENGKLRAVDLRTGHVTEVSEGIVAWQLSSEGVYIWSTEKRGKQRIIHLRNIPADLLGPGGHMAH